MFQNHIKITASAENLNSLKKALKSIIEKLDCEEISTVIHDDYNFTYETFDNKTLETFEIDPNEFMFIDLPSNL